MNKKILLVALLIGMLAFGAGLGTYAWFTSQATSENNEFTAGTLIINENTTALPVTAPATLGDLKPGDSEEYSFDVDNTGSLNLKYRVRLADVTGDLTAGANPLKVYLDGTEIGSISNDMLVVQSTNLNPDDAAVTHTLKFELPQAADNFYQGASCNFKVQIEAIQENADWADYSWENNEDGTETDDTETDPVQP